MEAENQEFQVEKSKFLSPGNPQETQISQDGKSEFLSDGESEFLGRKICDWGVKVTVAILPCLRVETCKVEHLEHKCPEADCLKSLL